LLYRIDHKNNKYYRSGEILGYVIAAMKFWTKIQNKNGSFNEWYPNEHSFVVTSFSAYAVSESLLLLKNDIPQDEYQIVLKSLKKAGDWLVRRNETRVMNQQTGASVALLNLYLLTSDTKYLVSSKEKIALLSQRQSKEGWFLEYGGPDIGYLSLAIDYLSKYYLKTGDEDVLNIVALALNFIKHFIQPNLVAGGEYTSRNTEYLIPHGFEALSKMNEDALFAASAVRAKISSADSFPHILDDRYLTYNGYTWLQAYLDYNPALNAPERIVEDFFSAYSKKYFQESGLMIINDEYKHLIINLKKGGAFRLFDKKAGSTYSDSGILVKSEDKWYTSGWLTEGRYDISDNEVIISGNMWKVTDKTLTTLRYILFRMFQLTFGRSCTISLWIKERLRDILITRARPSGIKYERRMTLNPDDAVLLGVSDSAASEGAGMSSMSVFTKDTYVYVPSSRYYAVMKESPITKNFPKAVDKTEINWRIRSDAGAEVIEK
jgi:hypothetical protein